MWGARANRTREEREGESPPVATGGPGWRIPMSDPRNPDVPADALPDPEEAELIAYLDGELDPADARRVEDRLDEDPTFRAKADALKKSYDLLDYLPR